MVSSFLPHFSSASEILPIEYWLMTMWPAWKYVHHCQGSFTKAPFSSSSLALFSRSKKSLSMFSQSFTKLSNCWMIAWKISFSFRVRDKLPKQLKTNPHLQPVFRKWRGENGEDVSKDEGIKLSWAVAEKVMRTVQTLAESPVSKPNGWKRRDDWFKNQHHSSLTCSKSQLLCKLPPPTSLTIPELPAFSSPDPRVDPIYCISLHFAITCCLFCQVRMVPKGQGWGALYRGVVTYL